MFDYVLGVFLTPVASMKRIAEERPALQAFAALLVAGLFGVWTIRYGQAYHAVHWFTVLTKVNWFLACLLGCLFASVAWFVRSAVWNLVAEILGGRGSGLSMLSAMGFASLPLVMLFILLLICALFGHGDLAGGPAGAMWRLVASVVLLWIGCLIVVGIREVHQFNTGRALAVLVITACFAALVGALVALCLSLSGLHFGELRPWA